MNINDFKRKIQEKQAEITKAIHRTLPIKIGRKAADHFQDNFRKGGYVNNGLHPWPQTQRQKAGGDHAYSQYGPLLSARNYLYGSIRYVPGDAIVTVGTSVPYVAVQLLQKFRGTQLGVHLQEHQSNLTLRGEAVSYVQARCFQT